MKSWYTARIRFVSHTDNRVTTDALWEDSLRLVYAESEVDARQRAEDIGKNAQHEYKNESGEVVSWHYVSVLEVFDLCESELVEGTEVFSRLFWRDQPES